MSMTFNFFKNLFELVLVILGEIFQEYNVFYSFGFYFFRQGLHPGGWPYTFYVAQAGLCLSLNDRLSYLDNPIIHMAALFAVFNVILSKILFISFFIVFFV